MSLITGFKLQVEEYASQASWIEKLLRPLNNFSQSTVNAVNGGLIVGKNVMATYKTVRVTVPPVPWVNLTPENSTQATGEPTLGYVVDASGTVYLRGAVSPTSKADGTVMFTLPDASLYPEFTQTLPLNHDHGSSHAYCTLSSTDGKLRIYNLSNSANKVFFNSIFFFAQNSPAPKQYDNQDWPIKLATDMPVPVKAAFVAAVTDVNGQPNDSVEFSGLDWEAISAAQIQIKRIGGLTPLRQYDITVLMIGG